MVGKGGRKQNGGRERKKTKWWKREEENKIVGKGRGIKVGERLEGN